MDLSIVCGGGPGWWVFEWILPFKGVVGRWVKS